MAYTNSPLVVHTNLSPNKTAPRNNSIKKVTIHHVAGNMTVESLGTWFAKSSTGSSSHYGIGSDGRVGMYVEEKNRAWTSSSGPNDHQAVTIEVANSATGNPWPVSDKAYATLIDLVTDICKRNGIAKLIFTGDATGNITMHRYFKDKVCPGPYLEARYPDIVAKVNARLSGAPVVIVKEPEPEVIEETGGLTMAQYEELKAMIDAQANVITNLQNQLGTLISTSNTGNDPSGWAKESTDWCINRGIFTGDDEGNFGWQKPITREAIASILYRLISSANTGDDSSEWAKEAVEFCKDHDIIAGDGEGNFGWKKFVTLESAAQLIYNILQEFDSFEEDPDDYDQYNGTHIIGR